MKVDRCSGYCRVTVTEIFFVLVETAKILDKLPLTSNCFFSTENKILTDFSWEELTIISFFSPNTLEELEKIGQFFEVSIHFYLGH